MTFPPAGSRVRVTDSSGPGSGAVVLDERFDASMLHVLRERVAACAARAGVPQDRAADVLLAVHELAANAVRHGAGAGRLLVRAATGRLLCQVSDAGPGTGPWPVRQGHGLWIVQAAADEVYTSCGPDGSQVTAIFGWRTATRSNFPR